VGKSHFFFEHEELLLPTTMLSNGLETM
jgi:hypothetical protein